MDSILIKEVHCLLKKLHKLQEKLLKLEEKGKFPAAVSHILLNDYDGELTVPPRRACLKMSQVLHLHTLRHKGQWKKTDCVLVVEPQSYDKITKLTPEHMMFDDQKISKRKELVFGVGYFHSGKSQVVQSGDGGDHGDRWWRVSKSLIIWLNKVLNKGQQVLHKFK